ncbi:MAG: 4Fe-4S binding protein [Gammaproteobacteria bacterium]|nr:4Fe-4S binding protein [Gammaproteobacteria bacterium]
MHILTDSALRLLKRLFGGTAQSGKSTGTQGVFDGDTAVGLVEAAISQDLGISISNPGDRAAMAWRSRQHDEGSGSWGAMLDSAATDGPRGSLTYATGLALSGVRASAFLSGLELASVQDLLAILAGRHLPLVIHVNNQSLGGVSSALGSGHEACHLSADSGCFILVAATVQEAVDFTLIARQAGEQGLVPGLVFMDREQTAQAPQQSELPGEDLLLDYLGNPDDSIPANQAQRLLFGEQRRRLPRWHDPDRPVLLGGVHPPVIWGMGQVAARLYLERDFAQVLDASFAQFARISGRRYSPVSRYRVEGAELLLVAMGSAIETAELVADHVRAAHKLKVGVLGIRCLRPFPGRLIAGELGNAHTVCVLERLDPPMQADPPLLRELVLALDHHRPAMARPRLIPVLYGIGGSPLDSGDLLAFCLRATDWAQPRCYLGIHLDAPSSSYPKRQVLLDRLRRDYPELGRLSVTATEEGPDLRPPGAITVAVNRVSGGTGETLALDVAELIWRAEKGELRSRPAISPAPWGSDCVDQFTWAPEGLRDPADRQPADLLVLTSGTPATALTEARLATDGTVLIEGGDTAGALQEGVPNSTGATHRIFRIDPLPLKNSLPPRGDLRNERLLGATCQVLLERGLLDSSRRRLSSSRESALAGLPSALRDERLAAFRSGLETVHEVTDRIPDTGSTAPSPSKIPARLTGLGTSGDTYDNLPRFWGQIGVLQQDRAGSELAPDPYLASGALPPFSSALRSLEGLRASLPVLDAEACTGCGACWSLCPDGAVGVTALRPDAVLEAGIKISGADSMRPLAARLSQRISELCKKPGQKPATASVLLEQAFDWLAHQPLPESRKLTLEAAGKKLLSALGPLQISITEPMFGTIEEQQPGGGNLLFLSIDPASCKGCGICALHCTPQALTMTPHSPTLLSDVRQLRDLWEQLPETSVDTIERTAVNSEPGPAAAMLLSRAILGSLAGGDGAEPGSGERLAIRLTLAAAEARQRPLRDRYIVKLEDAREAISRLIRQILADALPADDLDALASGLAQTESVQVDLSQLLGDSGAGPDARVDTLRLRRLVTLARQLRDLVWRLREGQQGLGRAALGLVLSAESPAGWTGAFPDNPFGIPVSVDATGDGPQLAAGLQQGQIHQTIEGMVLLRKARLELESPADAARQWSNLEQLGWDDLDDEERALCPRVLVIGSNALLAGRGLSQLYSILGGTLPVKLLVFAELDLGIAGIPQADLSLAPLEDTGSDLGLLALSRRQAFIAQCAVGYPDHLLDTLKKALDYPGPALVQVNAPCPKRHGFPTDRTIHRSRLAVDSRTFPLFVFDPRADGVFGTRFNLDGNPEAHAGWYSQENGSPLTTVEWALGEHRFTHCFSPIQPDAPDPMPLADYLNLQEERRRDSSPWVAYTPAGGQETRYRVAVPLIRSCEQRFHGWRMLQEVAGLVTPFTQRVKQQAKDAVAASHQSELDELKSSYENRIRHLHDEMLQQARREIRDRLLSMAGYQEANGRPPRQPNLARTDEMADE